MKNAIIWDVTLIRTNFSEECIAYMIRATSVLQLLVTANVVCLKNTVFWDVFRAVSMSDVFWEFALCTATWYGVPEDIFHYC
jgi:hypothetical protein